MKKIIFNFILLASMISSTSVFAQGTKANCNMKAMKKDGVTALDPYYYSSAKVTEVAYRDTAYNQEIAVPMFKGEKYRMVFNGKELPAGVEINIYDKDKSYTNRKAVYSTSTSSSELITYEPENSKRHYINYRIPAGSNLESSCIVFVLGYQLTFIK